VNVLDTPSEKVGTKSWHQVGVIEKRDSEVDKEFGGSWRSRTYGPLIKSPAKDPFQDTQQEESSVKREDL
jgi:hypothetical protein